MRGQLQRLCCAQMVNLGSARRLGSCESVTSKHTGEEKEGEIGFLQNCCDGLGRQGERRHGRSARLGQRAALPPRRITRCRGGRPSPSRCWAAAGALRYDGSSPAAVPPCPPSRQGMPPP